MAANTTSNLGLKYYAPDSTDTFSVKEGLNDNWQTIDNINPEKRLTDLESDMTEAQEDIAAIQAKNISQDTAISDISAHPVSYIYHATYTGDGSSASGSKTISIELTDDSGSLLNRIRPRIVYIYADSDAETPEFVQAFLPSDSSSLQTLSGLYWRSGSLISGRVKVQNGAGHVYVTSLSSNAVNLSGVTYHVTALCDQVSF